MRILLSGSSGLIGSHLRSFLLEKGDEVVRLVRRRENAPDAVYWDPDQGMFQKDDFEGFDAVIHLAGAGLTDERWTQKRKEELFLSRCRDTWLLSQVLLRLNRAPKTLLCASGVGFYGDRSDEELSESSARGQGFLADLCVKWENATDAIENRGTRVVHLRFGPVLSDKGGMLGKMLGPFRLGLGGKLGSGRQWISWIAIEDLLGACAHCLDHEEISGPVNFSSPHPVTQGEFARVLAKKLHRPAFCNLPAWLLIAIFGEMAKETLLVSQKMMPEVLLKTGYRFQCPDLKGALDRILGR